MSYPYRTSAVRDSCDLPMTRLEAILMLVSTFFCRVLPGMIFISGLGAGMIYFLFGRDDVSKPEPCKEGVILLKEGMGANCSTPAETLHIKTITSNGVLVWCTCPEHDHSKDEP